MIRGIHYGRYNTDMSCNAKYTQIENRRILHSRHGLACPGLAGPRHLVGARSWRVGESEIVVLQSVWHRSGPQSWNQMSWIRTSRWDIYQKVRPRHQVGPRSEGFGESKIYVLQSVSHSSGPQRLNQMSLMHTSRLDIYQKRWTSTPGRSHKLSIWEIENICPTKSLA